MEQVSLRGDFLRDAVFDVFGEDVEDPLLWLKDYYAEEIAAYRGPGDPLAEILSVLTGLDWPVQGDPVLFFLQNGNFGERPIRARIVNGELIFTYEDTQVQITATVNADGELEIGYDDTQIGNIQLVGNNLYYDYLGA
jgi:hypothetical protein